MEENSISLQRESLKNTLRRSWISLASIGFAVSIFAFSMVSYLDFKKSLNRVEDDLKTKSIVIDRRISAEILGGRKAVTENVIRDLVSWYDLKSIEEVQGSAPCESQDACVRRLGGEVVSYRKLSESLTGNSYLKIEVSFPTFFSSLHWSYLFSVFTPIFGLFILGIYLQRRILNRSLIEPISSLVKSSYLGQEPPSEWPEELADLSVKLERAFQERDQAMIGQLASGVLHDIKTYLHSVSLAVDLATEKKGTEKYAARLESLHRACAQQIPKMKAVIEAVLDGSREINVRPTEVLLKNIVSSAVNTTLELSEQSGVEIIDEVDLDTVVDVDPVQFERAISNLVKNAIEAANEKLVLDRMSGALVRISAQTNSDGFSFIVEDSGTGFSFNESKLFEKMKTTKIHGTGLGLLVTRKIVEAHHGTIRADRSESLGGAKLVIQLPSRTHGGGKA